MSDAKLPRRKAVPDVALKFTHVDHGLPEGRSRRCLVVFRGQVVEAWFGCNWRTKPGEVGHFENADDRIIKPTHWAYWPVIGGGNE